MDKSLIIVNFIGMMTEPWTILDNILKKRNIKFEKYGGSFNKNSNKIKSYEENKKLIRDSIISPALQTSWQVDHGYIPCRIFKNISYGKMGMTNNRHVQELFDNELIYDNDIEKLVDLGLEFEKKENKLDIVKKLMKDVRDNHTYLNRIEFLQWYLKEFMNYEL